MNGRGLCDRFGFGDRLLQRGGDEVSLQSQPSCYKNVPFLRARESSSCGIEARPRVERLALGRAQEWAREWAPVIGSSSDARGIEEVN